MHAVAPPSSLHPFTSSHNPIARIQHRDIYHYAILSYTRTLHANCLTAPYSNAPCHHCSLHDISLHLCSLFCNIPRLDPLHYIALLHCMLQHNMFNQRAHCYIAAHSTKNCTLHHHLLLVCSPMSALMDHTPLTAPLLTACLICAQQLLNILLLTALLLTASHHTLCITVPCGTLIHHRFGEDSLFKGS